LFWINLKGHVVSKSPVQFGIDKAVYWRLVSDKATFAAKNSKPDCLGD
jgi:hypothetical protein